MLDALSPQRRRLVVLLVALGVAGLLAVGTAIAVRSLSRGSSAPQERPGPVLLVPGYGGGVAALGPLAAQVRAAGREAVVVPPLGDGTGDLQTQAEHLGVVADQARAAAGAESVDVIGYSAGGVVARLWVRDSGGAAPVRRVLTIGSPQHGTSQAALGRELAGGCPAACEQLVPDSDLLRRLNAGDETPPGPVWATVRSAADVVVTPTDSATLDGALNILVQDVCPGSTANHGDLPADPVVAAVLVSVLGVDPPTPPTPLAC